MGMRHFVPIWATEDLNLSRNWKTETNLSVDEKLYQLFSGITLSDCAVPCTLTTVYTKYLSKNLAPSNETLLYFTFSNEVLVDETTMVEFNLLTSLSILGSNLGLWLGLGALQMLEYLSKYNCFEHCKFCPDTSINIF